MIDITALVAKASLFDERRKNGADAANESPGAAAFQQQFNHALGVGNSPASQTANAVTGTTGAADQRKVGMAAPQSSVAAYQDAVGAQGPGAQALTDYMAMPLQERMFYTILASMGVSKEQYDAMSPTDKAALAAKVEDRIKQAATTPDASRPDNTTAQGQRFAPVVQTSNAEKTRADAGNRENPLLA
jgi:hypothetical protein